MRKNAQAGVVTGLCSCLLLKAEDGCYIKRKTLKSEDFKVLVEISGIEPLTS